MSVPGLRRLRAAVLTVVTLIAGRSSDKFAPGVCERVEPFLKSRIVGQDQAISQLSDALCSHVSAAGQGGSAGKPLVMSIHGPPGVGKTMTHMLLAKALYNAQPDDPTLECPGADCKGAHVIVGVTHEPQEQQSQLAAVRQAILDHARRAPDPLIVVEEYDKMDCATRTMLRQMIEHAWLQDGATLHRAIFILESNVGYIELDDMLTRANGDRTRVPEEEVERRMKDAVVTHWRRNDCEDYVDTIKFASTVDQYLAYFPLQRREIALVTTNALKRWLERFRTDKSVALKWTDDVVQFLTGKVDFDGPYPLEGASKVEVIVTRHVGRIFRSCVRTKAHAGSQGTAVMMLKINDNRIVGTLSHGHGIAVSDGQSDL